VNSPRIHAQLYPIDVEAEDTFDANIKKALAAMGYIVREETFTSAVQGIVYDGGVLYGASDMRKKGAPAGY